jgi:hypothetical protein
VQGDGFGIFCRGSGCGGVCGGVVFDMDNGKIGEKGLEGRDELVGRHGGRQFIFMLVSGLLL